MPTTTPTTSPTAPEPIFLAEGLTKTFTARAGTGRPLRRARTGFTAVDGIDLRVAPGELVGYIGPNGAGKSTTIKMLTGILTPTSGRLRVAGHEPHRERIRLARRIGVVFGQRTTLWWDLPLRDSFTLLQRLYRIPPARFAANLSFYTEALDLGPFLDRPVRQLSLGQRMRGDIAAALLHDPAVVYLDEPTIGLDVVSKHAVREFLRELNRRTGTTILLTTHDTDDIELLCTRVVVIDHGRIGYDGPLEVLRADRDLEAVVRELYTGRSLVDTTE
jgi:ABC-2 type transport system ATP-binding protein